MDGRAPGVCDGHTGTPTHGNTKVLWFVPAPIPTSRASQLPMPHAGSRVTHLESREQPAAAVPDGFVILGTVLLAPVPMLVNPSQDRDLTPAPGAKGDTQW